MSLLYPEKMKEITVVVHREFTDKVVKSLHESGAIEILDVNKSGRDFVDILSPGKAHEKAHEAAELEMQITNFIDILSKEKEEEPSLKETMSAFLSPPLPPKYEISPREYVDIKNDTEAMIESLGPKLSEIEKNMEGISEELGDLAEHMIQVGMLRPFELNLKHLGDSEYTIIKTGTTSDITRLKASLRKVKDHLIFSHQIDKKTHSAVVVSHIEEKKALEDALKGVFNPFNLPSYEGKPEEVLKNIEKRVKDLKSDEELIFNDLNEMRGTLSKKLLILQDEIAVVKARFEILSKFGKTDSTEVITGWAPEIHLNKISKLIEKESKGFAHLSAQDPKNTEDTPIYRKNPKWSRPFEMLTEMFALPNYDEVDPTIIIAPIFVIYFGLMLGDAIYGLLVLLAGILLLKGQGKVEKVMHDMGVIFTCIGISTVIFGILQGGYLGPLTDDNPLTPVLGPLGVENLILLDSMNNPIPLLILALIIGLLHLNLGLILSMAQNLRKKAYADVLYSNISWFILQASAIVLFFSFFKWGTFPDIIMNLASIGALIGIVLVFLQYTDEAAESGKRKRKGPLGFFDITGFVGNFLSYARILALGLATAGIAMTVNIIADLIGDMFSGMASVMVCSSILIIGLIMMLVGIRKNAPPAKAFSVIFMLVGIVGAIGGVQFAVGIILALVFIAGHLINAVLQALGGFIHALRLQYVEFFGQFYSGGGNKFSPFEAERKHTVKKN
jgi:V/A-type H+-transporting ATPase subunit I